MLLGPVVEFHRISPQTITKPPYLCHSFLQTRPTPHLMRLSVLMRIHCGIGLFCFCFFAKILLILKVFWDGWEERTGRMGQPQKLMGDKQVRRQQHGSKLLTFHQFKKQKTTAYEVGKCGSTSIAQSLYDQLSTSLKNDYKIRPPKATCSN
jgi:hypothetical protein